MGENGGNTSGCWVGRGQRGPGRQATTARWRGGLARLPIPSPDVEPLRARPAGPSGQALVVARTILLDALCLAAAGQAATSAVSPTTMAPTASHGTGRAYAVALFAVCGVLALCASGRLRFGALTGDASTRSRTAIACAKGLVLTLAVSATFGLALAPVWLLAAGFGAVALLPIEGLNRIVVRAEARRGRLVPSALLLGTGVEARRLCERLRAHPESGFRLVGVVGDGLPQAVLGIECPWLGRTAADAQPRCRCSERQSCSFSRRPSAKRNSRRCAGRWRRRTLPSMW